MDAFRLHPDAGLSEESLTESETRNKRYCKAMTLKLPRSDIESDLEETQSLLLFHQQDVEEERSSLRVWFAAENEKQHLSWQSKSTFPPETCASPRNAGIFTTFHVLQSISLGEL